MPRKIARHLPISSECGHKRNFLTSMKADPRRTRVFSCSPSFCIVLVGHMTSQSSLPQRLAGFYCLYCLYECQPYKPHFKIYPSLEKPKKLKDFVAEAEQSGVGLVPALVKRMLDKGMFLFGFINLLGDHGAKQVDELNSFQNKLVKCACEKLFANTQIESYMHTDLGAEFELDSIKKLSMDYAKAKELAFAEASQTVDVEDAKHILQNDKLLVDRVEDIVRVGCPEGRVLS